MKRPVYPSDLDDKEWQLLEPLLPPPKPGGRPVKYPRREIVNAIRYVLRTGCSWRMLPHDLPPWRIVFHYFRTWRKDRTWQGPTTPSFPTCDNPRVGQPVPALPSLTASR